jgi:hypothetical protein
VETDLEIASIIRELEARLLQPHTRQSPEEVRALLADEFVEFGSSGRVWDKESTIAALQQEKEDLETPTRAIHDFSTRRLAADVILVTYRIIAVARSRRTCTLRSSIWRLVDRRWQMSFHQGTPSKLDDET